MKYRLLVIVCILMAGAGGVLWWGHRHQAKTGSPTTSSTAAFNKQLYPLDQPSSLWVIVNKPHPLNPLDYKPTDLVVPNVPQRVPGNESMQVRRMTATALEAMFAAATKQNIKLMLSSGYRSFTYQVGVYNDFVAKLGKTATDQQSARPGHSEHQTGLAVDIESFDRSCETEVCFGNLPEGKWLVAHAAEYGFLLRYPADKVATTGYEYEPWHFRYVGQELAAELQRQHIKTLEEFFGVRGGPNY